MTGSTRHKCYISFRLMTLQQDGCVMFLAPTRHVVNIRPSRDSPHQAVISCLTPEYQCLWFQFYRASNFTAWQLPQNHRRHPARRRPQTGQPSTLLQRRRRRGMLQVLYGELGVTSYNVIVLQPAAVAAAAIATTKIGWTWIATMPTATIPTETRGVGRPP